MPGRRSSTTGSSGGGQGGLGGGDSSGGSGGNRGGLPVGMVILLIVAYVLYSLFIKNDASQDNAYDTGGSYANDTFQGVDGLDESYGDESAAPTLAPTRRADQPTATNDPNRVAKTWTVLLYQDADDSSLERDIVMDLNEAESVGSDANVNIVAQLDRYAGGYQGDGDWTGARRYYLTQDDDLFQIHSPVVADLGEVSMADPQTLVDFTTWAIQAYPAERYVLILSDHGMGWPGGLTDPAPGQRRAVNNAFARAINENMMYTSDIDAALDQILAQSGIQRFELVGLDACLMSHLEVYSALAPYASFVVNSQETEPALGWAYASFLQALEDDPAMEGDELGKQIVDSYIEDDLRIQDQQARRDYLRQGSPLSGLLSGTSDVNPRALSQQIEKSVTLTAARMDALPGLEDALNQLVYVLQSEDQATVARARTYAQSFTSVFGRDVPPSYIDLGNFAQLLVQESVSEAVRNAAQQVVDAVGQVVVAEKHGRQKPGSTGISIYFPNSQQYQTSLGGAQAYTQVANRFAQDSLWDDFLAFHYTHTPFQADTRRAAVPASGMRMSAPGSGAIQISSLVLSAAETDYDQPVTLQADLSGENVGYVYLFVGYLDPSSQAILVADMDYLESPQTRRLGDLYYPNWTDQASFHLKYTWMPTVFAIHDGQQDVVALLTPERYGASAEEAVYTTDGYFTNGESGETRYARLYFSGGQLRQVFGFTGTEPTGAMSELSPQIGDQFTILQTWLEPDGAGGYQSTNATGETLTFGEQPLSWSELYAAAGDYRIGFVVTDLDGQQAQALSTLTVR